jgi:outer membrane protein assembly factor BamE (lipoprotein component of BamABCDE complex)|tara:strand:+ start:557 stop:1006 length:450 start_codon:yes stop_codon:yes gene_type:complete
MKRLFYLGIFIISISGCITAAEHAKQLHSDSDRQITVGVVQKEIKKGMSQPDVAAALGSPNIVSKDKEGLETWIYDKIATEVSYSSSSIGGGAGGLLIGIGSGVGGALGGGISGGKASGAAAQTQKTLTVIIKFREGLVHDFSYHSSKF